MSAFSPLDPCGCCEADAQPAERSNRPGLNTLPYRIGQHGSFLRRMLSRLPLQSVPPGDPTAPRPLAALTTRAPDDPAVALLDAWSRAADVLTFYQERIANEGYLRTATERRSILELARTIGYELSPGVAASAALAFTIEDALAASEAVVVPHYTRVQSVPGPGELPQSFETGEQITARPEWNTLRPRLRRPQELAVGDDGKLYLLGLSTRFGAGATTLDTDEVFPLDPELDLPVGEVEAAELQRFYIAGTATQLRAGDPLLFVGQRSGEVRTLVKLIHRVVDEPELDRTRIDFVARSSVPAYAVLMPAFAAMPLATRTMSGEEVAETVGGHAWRESDLTALMGMQGWSAAGVTTYLNTSFVMTPLLLFGDVPTVQVAPGVFAFRVQSGFFGHNAPSWSSLPVSQRIGEWRNTVETDGTQGALVFAPGPYREDWDPDGWEIWRAYPSEEMYAGSGAPGPADVYLERGVKEVVAGSWTLFEDAGSETERFNAFWVKGVRQASLTGFAISAKTTGIELAAADGNELGESDKPSRMKVRSTTAHVASEALTLAELPIEDALTGDSVQLDHMVLGFRVGQPLALSGENRDLPGVIAREIVTLADIVHANGFTTLTFQNELEHAYVRDTVTLNANVVFATHGESVAEVLGSGDGSQVHQRFGLRKPPLTHVPAPTPSGSRSTLEMRVNDILWEQAPTLYGLNGDDECYVLERDDDGNTTVLFGDGEMGARLPTGTENVRATYRSGIGVAGMVAADKLTLLQTRPLGVRGVTNPLPASGAEDPESRDDARRNAPLTVLTLDRIVSLRDWEDFARAFAGVGKAAATLLSAGNERRVHLSVAAAAAVGGSEGSLATRVIDPGSPLLATLTDALRGASDPGQRFEVASYQPLFFNVRAKLWVDPRHDTAATVAAAVAALQAGFGFAARAFGQSVPGAEVIATIHNVPGVIAVDLDQLYLYRDGEAPPAPTEQITPEILPVKPARWDEDAREVHIAQLLLINPAGIFFEVEQR